MLCGRRPRAGRRRWRCRSGGGGPHGPRHGRGRRGAGPVGPGTDPRLGSRHRGGRDHRRRPRGGGGPAVPARRDAAGPADAPDRRAGRPARTGGGAVPAEGGRADPLRRRRVHRPGAQRGSGRLPAQGHRARPAAHRRPDAGRGGQRAVPGRDPHRDQRLSRRQRAAGRRRPDQGDEPARARGAATVGAGPVQCRHRPAHAPEHRDGEGLRQRRPPAAGGGQPGPGGHRRPRGRHPGGGRGRERGAPVTTSRQRLLVDVGVVGLALVDSWVRAVHEENGLVVSLLAALALTVRRRWPFFTFALMLPALFGADVLVAPLAALYSVAATSRSRVAVLSCAVIVALGRFLPWPLDLQDIAAELRHLTPLIFATLYAAAPVALGILVSTRRELSQRLEQLTAGRQRLQQLVSETVIAQERASLAREMHDVVSHKVSLIAVQAGALRVTAQDPGVRDSADTIRKLSVQTLEELRHMVGVLRADGGHVPQLAPQPGLPDVPRLIRDSGLDAPAALEEVGDRRWPESIERAVYRTVQEALTNVSKHAPGAPVTVRITPSCDGLQVAVRNGPSAMPPPTSHLPGGRHGLRARRGRAELLGGFVPAAPPEEGGSLVGATFPRASAGERRGRGCPPIGGDPPADRRDAGTTGARPRS